MKGFGLARLPAGLRPPRHKIEKGAYPGQEDGQYAVLLLGCHSLPAFRCCWKLEMHVANLAV